MTKRAWVEQIMGMPISIHVRVADPGDPEVQRTVAAAFTELRRMEDLFSTFKPDSPVGRLRRGEIGVDECDPLVAEAGRLGEAAHACTGGAFTTRIPDADGIPRFDPTGLVKGWAVDRAGGILAALPGASWCINAGGDVLAGRHRHIPATGADAAPWRIGVEDPHQRSRIARVVPLVDGAVATSGTAARGAHLYDPLEDRWMSRPGSTTVVGPELLWADVWATALFVGGPQTRAAFAATGLQSVDL